MPIRILPLVNNYFYHILNRGIEKRNIFLDDRDYKRFLKILKYYQYAEAKRSFSKLTNEDLKNAQRGEKIVEIISYCLMPNHFHLLIKQVKDKGISDFIRKISNGYTRYFNTKYRRIGPLFQGPYKAVMVESDEQLTHLSRYIHLNPKVSFLVKDLNSYPWSSYTDYIGLENNDLVNKEEILGFFKDQKSYENFVLEQADYGIMLQMLKHQLLDGEEH